MLLEDKLLNRSLERRRSTRAATHLTCAQLEAALMPFDLDEETPLFAECAADAVWAACGDGEIREARSPRP